MVQTSLLWRIWTHWNELCKASFEDRDTNRRCFISTKLGHLAKNYMNTGKVEDERRKKIITSKNR